LELNEAQTINLGEKENAIKSIDFLGIEKEFQKIRILLIKYI